MDSHSVQALLDSGATDCFLDWKYIRQHQLQTTRLDHAIPVYNIDGSTNADGSITHKCEMNVQHKDHLKKIDGFMSLDLETRKLSLDILG